MPPPPRLSTSDYLMLAAGALLALLAALSGGCAALAADAANPLLPVAPPAAVRREAGVPSVMPAWRAWFVREGVNNPDIARIVGDNGIAESARFTQVAADGHVVDVFFVAAEAVPGGAALWKAAYVATWEPDGEGWRFEVRDPLRRQDPVGARPAGGGAW